MSKKSGGDVRRFLLQLSGMFRLKLSIQQDSNTPPIVSLLSGGIAGGIEAGLTVGFENRQHS